MYQSHVRRQWTYMDVYPRLDINTHICCMWCHIFRIKISPYFLLLSFGSTYFYARRQCFLVRSSSLASWSTASTEAVVDTKKHRLQLDFYTYCTLIGVKTSESTIERSTGPSAVKIDQGACLWSSVRYRYILLGLLLDVALELSGGRTLSTKQIFLSVRQSTTWQSGLLMCLRRLLLYPPLNINLCTAKELESCERSKWCQHLPLGKSRLSQLQPASDFTSLQYLVCSRWSTCFF